MMKAVSGVLVIASVLLAVAGWTMNDLAFLFPQENETLSALNQLQAQRVRQINKGDPGFSLLHELWPKDDPDFKERRPVTHIGLETCYQYSGPQSGSDCDLVINLRQNTLDNGWPISHAVTAINTRIKVKSTPWRWALAVLAAVVIIAEKIITTRQSKPDKKIRIVNRKRPHKDKLKRRR